MDEEGRSQGPEIRVRGSASPDETAAVLAAVRAHLDSQRPQRTTPAWLRAGLREGLGDRPAAEPSDLR